MAPAVSNTSKDAPRGSSDHEDEIKLDSENMKLSYWKYGDMGHKHKNSRMEQSQDAGRKRPLPRTTLSLHLDEHRPHESARDMWAITTVSRQPRDLLSGALLVRDGWVVGHRGRSRAIDVDGWRSTIDALNAIPFLCIVARLARLPRVFMGLASVATSPLC